MSNGRFAKATKQTEKVSSRFGKERAHKMDKTAKAAPRASIRKKTEKKQKPFRLSVDLIDDLAFLKFLTGDSEQLIVETGLEEIVEKRLKEIEKEKGPEQYKSLKNAFKSVN